MAITKPLKLEAKPHLNILKVHGFLDKLPVTMAEG
jgi:hypothetical protein